MGVEKRLHKWW